MHPELRQFLIQLVSVVGLALLPVVATTFLAVPYALQAAPGDEPPAHARVLHFT